MFATLDFWKFLEIKYMYACTVKSGFRNVKVRAWSCMLDNTGLMGVSKNETRFSSANSYDRGF